jgi:hypothetical protein
LFEAHSGQNAGFATSDDQHRDLGCALGRQGRRTAGVSPVEIQLLGDQGKVVVGNVIASRVFSRMSSRLSGFGSGQPRSRYSVITDSAAARARVLSSSDMNPCTSLRKMPICLNSRMNRGSPVICTSESSSVGMLTSSSAAAISGVDVVKGWPA